MWLTGKHRRHIRRLVRRVRSRRAGRLRFQKGQQLSHAVNRNDLNIKIERAANRLDA